MGSAAALLGAPPFCCCRKFIAQNTRFLRLRGPVGASPDTCFAEVTVFGTRAGSPAPQNLAVWWSVQGTKKGQWTNSFL